ncbi:MAG TPA: NAD(P)/FAD-dependent oxidoreductase [Bryobacteraceae bacterium]|jgi:2-polyprenyl-6-methoxyphenol hydroxylase-like FAD-dependent oxidoreductase|nr:NAD(P)/FAD-dependent oxidoreductase [Bryobacteraceae bacterium]
MSEQTFHVAIIGGGIGGLCLAQGLKKAGVSVAVYERDESVSSRPQGFRIHIDPQGSTALHQCLPENLWRIFDTTGGDFGHGFSVATERLQELLSVRAEGGPVDPIARHRSISRITLRRVLLAGLEEIVHFRKRFMRYEEMPDGRFRAHFEDGGTAMADVLVAADGVNSPVRKQYLPDADPVDTGVLGLGSRVPLSDGAMALAPDRLLDGPVMVIPPEPCSLFMAIWKRSQQAGPALRELGIDRPITGDENYIILGLGGQASYLGLGHDAHTLPSRELKDVLRRTVAHWHPNIRKLAEMTDEAEMSANRIRTSRPPAPWQTTRVTLLGDAIHSMTPYRGIGANIALKDAALLCSKLDEAHRGERPLLDAIAKYEESMRDYGFAAVEASRKSMMQAIGEKKTPAFQIAKAAMRVVNRVPALKRKLMPV